MTLPELNSDDGPAPLVLTHPTAEELSRQALEAFDASQQWQDSTPWLVQQLPQALSPSKIFKARKRGLKVERFRFERAELAKALALYHPDFAVWLYERAQPTTRRALITFLEWMATARLMAVAWVPAHSDLPALIPGWTKRTGQRWLSAFRDGGLFTVRPVFVYGRFRNKRSRAPSVYDCGAWLVAAIEATQRARGFDPNVPELRACVEELPLFEDPSWRGIRNDLGDRPDLQDDSPDLPSDTGRSEALATEPAAPLAPSDEVGAEDGAKTSRGAHGAPLTAEPRSDDEGRLSRVVVAEGIEGPEPFDWRAELERVRRKCETGLVRTSPGVVLHIGDVIAAGAGDVGDAGDVAPDAPAAAPEAPREGQGGGGPPPSTWCLQCGVTMAPDTPGPCQGPDRTLPWHYVVTEEELRPRQPPPRAPGKRQQR